MLSLQTNLRMGIFLRLSVPSTNVQRLSCTSSRSSSMMLDRKSSKTKKKGDRPHSQQPQKRSQAREARRTPLKMKRRRMKSQRVLHLREN